MGQTRLKRDKKGQSFPSPPMYAKPKKIQIKTATRYKSYNNSSLNEGVISPNPDTLHFIRDKKVTPSAKKYQIRKCI